jgi:hypothetical protein
METSLLVRLHLSASKVNCNICQRTFDTRDAQTMGTAFYHWAELFRGRVLEALKEIPPLTEKDIQRVFGSPYKDDMRLIASADELVRVCLRSLRHVLIEMARGREASLEVAHLRHDTTGVPEVVAVLGVSSAESGTKEYEVLVARPSSASFIMYVHPGHGTAELRVKRAVHAGTSVVSNSSSGVGMQAVAGRNGRH